MRNIHQKRNDLGCFNSLGQLWHRLPQGACPGDYAHIGNDIYVWDEHQHNWMLDTYANTDAYLLLQQTGDLHLQGDLRVGGRMTAWRHARFKGDVTIEGRLACKHVKGHDRGFFPNTEALLLAVPIPMRGDWAFVGNDEQPQLWQCTTQGEWERVGEANLGNAFDFEAFERTRDIVEDMARAGYVFEGVARPSTNPHRPSDHNVFYLSSLPGIYIHFNHIEVRQLSVLLWSLDENGQGEWTAVNLLNDTIADGAITTEKIADHAVTLKKMACDSVGTCQIIDGEVTLEKLSEGTVKYIDDHDRAIEDKIINLRQQISTTVKTITINGTENIKYRPDNLGNVNLVIPNGGGELEEDIANQVGENTDNIATLQQQVRELIAAGASNIVFIDYWRHDGQTPDPTTVGLGWYDPLTKTLKISDGTQWMEYTLDTRRAYVDTTNARILYFNGEDFIAMTTEPGSDGTVVVVKLWGVSAMVPPQGGGFDDGDFAFDSQLNILYRYTDGIWNPCRVSDECLYVNIKTGNAFVWQERLRTMVPVSQNITVDNALSASSRNPVQNKVVKAECESIKQALSQQATRVDAVEGGILNLQEAFNEMLDPDALNSIWKALLGTEQLVPVRNTPPLNPDIGQKYLDLNTGKLMRCTALNGSKSTFIVRLRLQQGRNTTKLASQEFNITPCEGERISLLIDEGWDLGTAFDLPSRTASTFTSRFKQALEDAGYGGLYTATDEYGDGDNPILDERAVRFVIQTKANRPLETLLGNIYRTQTASLRRVLFAPYSQQQVYYAYAEDEEHPGTYYSIDDNVDGTYDAYAEDNTQPDTTAVIPTLIQLGKDVGDILDIAQEIHRIAQDIEQKAESLVSKDDDEWGAILAKQSMYAAGPTTSLPLEPPEGMCYYDTTTHTPVWAAYVTGQGQEEPTLQWLDAQGQDPYEGTPSQA